MDEPHCEKVWQLFDTDKFKAWSQTSLSNVSLISKVMQKQKHFRDHISVLHFYLTLYYFTWAAVFGQNLQKCIIPV